MAVCHRHAASPPAAQARSAAVDSITRHTREAACCESHFSDEATEARTRISVTRPRQTDEAAEPGLRPGSSVPESVPLTLTFSGDSGGVTAGLPASGDLCLCGRETPLSSPFVLEEPLHTQGPVLSPRRAPQGPWWPASAPPACLPLPAHCGLLRTAHLQALGPLQLTLCWVARAPFLICTPLVLVFPSPARV